MADFPTTGPLVRDRAGNLYGTTQSGGDLQCIPLEQSQRGCGTVYKLTPGGRETILHSFTGAPTDGASPFAGVTLDSQGNLYGTTRIGGTECPGSGCGTVYKISPSGAETVLHSFTGGADGSVPLNVTLVMDSAGNLYGTTPGGGDPKCNCGVVFKIDRTGAETVLYTFTGADGEGPAGGVVRDAQGNLYGATGFGGSSNCGVVYKVDPAGVETVLHDFACNETGGGVSRLILDPAGNLYGTTLYGGSLSDGNVFEVSSQGVFTTLHSFDIDDGLYPETELLRDAAGNIFGMDRILVVFKITP
jgi:uncharacterized repeat protein (TIGR03803 family)